jgi:hypothetical protein
MENQLNFIETLFRRDKDEEKAIGGLKTLLNNLRYLKINTLLTTGLVARGVEDRLNTSIQIVATLHHVLSDREGSLSQYVTDCQNVTIYSAIPHTLEQLYDNVSKITVPNLPFELYGTVSAIDNLTTELNVIKTDLKNAI